MQRILPLMVVVSITLVPLGCKNPTGSSLSQNTTDRDVIHVAVRRDINPALRDLYDAVANNTPLTLHQLDLAAVAANRAISAEVEFPRANAPTFKGGNPRLDYNPKSQRDTYRGVPIGERVLIFKLSDQQLYSKTDKWEFFTWFGAGLLNDPVAGKYTGVAEQVRYVLDTKKYEPRRIAAMHDLVGKADFAANFLPGYAGTKSVVYGETSGEQVLGAIQVVGDIATFGLGSKINVVKRGAVALVLTASSARVAVAGGRAASGNANVYDGIDAFLATVEGTLAAVTIVKIRLRADNIVVSSLDEASALSKSLGRSADDIMSKGITKQELAKIGIDVDDLLPAKARQPGLPNPTVVPNLKFKSGRTSLQNALGPGEHVVIARSQSGHFELNIAGQRVHASGPLIPLSRASGGTLPEGSWLVFKDLPPDVLARLKANTQNLSRMPTLGCANGVCRVLEQAGIKVGSGGMGSGVLTSSTMIDIVQNGFSVAGKKLNIDIYATKAMSISDLISQSRHVDAKVIVKTPVVYLVLATSLAILGEDLYNQATTGSSEPLLFVLFEDVFE